MTMVLGGQSLPDPSSEEVEYFIRGTSYALADGTITHEYVSSEMKRRWNFTFRAVTSTILNGIISAYINTFTSDVSFTHYTTTVYTVTCPQARPPAKVTTVNAVVNRYDVSITLEQV